MSQCYASIYMTLFISNIKKSMMTWHIKKFQLPFLIDKVKKLWSKEIALVKVAWHNHENDEATWEVENEIREEIPTLI